MAAHFTATEDETERPEGQHQRHGGLLAVHDATTKTKKDHWQAMVLSVLNMVSYLICNFLVLLLGEILGQSHTGLVEEIVQRRNGLHET